MKYTLIGDEKNIRECYKKVLSYLCGKTDVPQRRESVQLLDTSYKVAIGIIFKKGKPSYYCLEINDERNRRIIGININHKYQGEGNATAGFFLKDQRNDIWICRRIFGKGKFEFQQILSKKKNIFIRIEDIEGIIYNWERYKNKYSKLIGAIKIACLSMEKKNFRNDFVNFIELFRKSTNPENEGKNSINSEINLGGYFKKKIFFI